MAEWKQLAHVMNQCSYHIVWTPKYRFWILGRYSKVCRTEDTDDLRMEACGNTGNKCDAGSCASGDNNPTQTVSLRDDGIVEREDRNSNIQTTK